MRIYHLIRIKPGPTPETAVVGIVADAAVFPDGISVLHWRTAPGNTEIYNDESEMRLIREKSGRSHFEEVSA